MPDAPTAEEASLRRKIAEGRDVLVTEYELAFIASLLAADAPQARYERMLAEKLKWFEESAISDASENRSSLISNASLIEVLNDSRHFVPSALHWAINVAVSRLLAADADRQRMAAWGFVVLSKDGSFVERCASLGMARSQAVCYNANPKASRGPYRAETLYAARGDE